MKLRLKIFNSLDIHVYLSKLKSETKVLSFQKILKTTMDAAYNNESWPDIGDDLQFSGILWDKGGNLVQSLPATPHHCPCTGAPWGAVCSGVTASYCS